MRFFAIDWQFCFLVQQKILKTVGFNTFLTYAVNGKEKKKINRFYLQIVYSKITTMVPLH